MSERRLVTAEELEKFPDDDHRYELVEGRVIRMSPVAWTHGWIVARLLTLLNTHGGSDVGASVTEVGFKLESNPDTVLAPDVAFVRYERIPAVDPRGFWNGPCDVAVEVLSPDDRPSKVDDKIGRYLRTGVLVVVVVDPEDETVSVHRRSTNPRVVRGVDTVFEIDDVIPGFTCTLGEIFRRPGHG